MGKTGSFLILGLTWLTSFSANAMGKKPLYHETCKVYFHESVSPWAKNYDTQLARKGYQRISYDEYAFRKFTSLYVDESNKQKSQLKNQGPLMTCDLTLSVFSYEPPYLASYGIDAEIALPIFKTQVQSSLQLRQLSGFQNAPCNYDRAISNLPQCIISQVLTPMSCR